MNYNVKKMVSAFSVLFIFLGLSGCATEILSDSISNHESGQSFYSDDIITAAAVTNVGADNYRWVFIGNHFDYSLTSGADDFLRALVTGGIDKSRLKVSEKGVFTLDKGKTRFSGNITLLYQYPNAVDARKIAGLLKLPYWNCSKNDGESGVCEIIINNIVGTIHKKSTVPAGVFNFSQPVPVNFFTHNSLSAKRALYPVAVAADVAMSPLYLIGVVAVLSVYGVLLMH